MTTLCLIGSFGLFGQTVIDFTDPATSTYGTSAQKNENGVMVMWAGNGNGDQKTVYIGPDSDIFQIAIAVLTNPANTDGEFTFPLSNAYHPADYNMDGQVLYIGPASDIFQIAIAVLTNPTNVDGEFTFPVEQQFPNTP